MSIEFLCGQCGKQLRTADDTAGKMARCPACGNIQRVPLQDAGRPAPPPPEDSANPFAERQSPAPGPSPFGPVATSNPFAEKPAPSNPYAAPSYTGGYQPFAVQEGYARAKVQGPAVALMVVYGLGAAMMGFVLVMFLVLMATGEQIEWEGLLQFVITFPLCAFVVYGANKMRQLESYNQALAAAICAMLPCTGCCLLGLPFGIWAIFALQDPHVKAAFR